MKHRQTERGLGRTNHDLANHQPAYSTPVLSIVDLQDLDATRREREAEVIARNPNGEPWDHVTEDELSEASRLLDHSEGSVPRN